LNGTKREGEKNPRPWKKKEKGKRKREILTLTCFQPEGKEKEGGENTATTLPALISTCSWGRGG